MSIEETLQEILRLARSLDERLKATEHELSTLSHLTTTTRLPELLAPKAIAVALNCKLGTVYNLFKEGRLTNRSTTRHVKASREDVAALMNEQPVIVKRTRPSFERRRGAYMKRKGQKSQLVTDNGNNINGALQWQQH